ncbi:MAG TPA: metallophosphoesterase family protein [Trueperaceae bacterium]
MRYLILSDIHADIRALERVLWHAEAQTWDEMVVLGDLVGYGPEPEDTVQRIIGLRPKVALRGNHEAMVLAAARGEEVRGRRDIRWMAARQAQALSAASLAFLGALPLQHLETAWGAAHGALTNPWDYLISVPVARANEPEMKRPWYFVGHTHLPGAFWRKGTAQAPARDAGWQRMSFRAPENRLQLPRGSRAFLNPGSVSLPRDGLRTGSYGIFDEDSGIFQVFRLGGS